MTIRFLTIFSFVSIFCSMSISEESTTQSNEKFSSTTRSSDITTQINQKFHNLTLHAESFVVAAFEEMKTRTNDLTYGIDPFEFDDSNAQYSFDFTTPFSNQELHSRWEDETMVVEDCSGLGMEFFVTMPFKSLPAAFQIHLLEDDPSISACVDYYSKIYYGPPMPNSVERYLESTNCFQGFEFCPRNYYGRDRDYQEYIEYQAEKDKYRRGELRTYVNRPSIYLNVEYRDLDGAYGGSYGAVYFYSGLTGYVTKHSIDNSYGVSDMEEAINNIFSGFPRDVYFQDFDTVSCQARHTLQKRLIVAFENALENQDIDKRSATAISEQVYADARRELARFFLQFSLDRAQSEKDVTAAWDYYDQLVRIHPVNIFLDSLDTDCGDQGVSTTSTLPVEDRVLNRFIKSVEEIHADALVIIGD